MTRPKTRLGWRGAWTFARRDLNASFRGLRLLFVCLFLGVATLAAIGSLTAAITEAPSDEVVAKLSLVVAGRGNATTETLRCFDMSEVRKLLT